MNILITGGTGFFGKSMLDYRLRHPAWTDAAWTILSRNPQKFILENPQFAHVSGVEFIAGDVRDFELPGRAFDAVIHAATPAVTTLSDDEMASIVVEGTRHALAIAKQCGARKFMLTSSGAVYGPQIASVDEDASCRPVTAYGKGKLLAEQMCRDSGLHMLLPRCFAFVGPYLKRDIHFAIGNFIRDCLSGNPIVINGDGTPMRSYLYADDLVEWLFAILEHGESGRPYNVGSGEGISIHDLAFKVRSVMGTSNEIVIRGKAGVGASSVYVPDVSRAERELGLRVKVGLEEAIRKSI